MSNDTNGVAEAVAEGQLAALVGEHLPSSVKFMNDIGDADGQVMVGLIKLGTTMDDIESALEAGGVPEPAIQALAWMFSNGINDVLAGAKIDPAHFREHYEEFNRLFQADMAVEAAKTIRTGAAGPN